MLDNGVARGNRPHSRNALSSQVPSETSRKPVERRRWALRSWRMWAVLTVAALKLPPRLTHTHARSN